MKATGTFEVSMQPAECSVNGKNGNQVGRLLLNKTFLGALVAVSQGEMLSVRTAEKGSAGYVVIEQVEGKLDGKVGGFILQHFGIMNRGEPRLILEVVPDSGSGELKGLSGKMTIDIKDGQHFYTFIYEIE